MKSVKKILSQSIIVIIVLCIQLITYLLFFHSPIIKWGATDYEVTMPMSGDKYAEIISSTRAIDISKPSTDVWGYLVDLGADRKGYYSYSFLEYLWGCEIAKEVNKENRELEVGRLIPYTIPDSNGNYTEGFKVIEVIQGQSFVIEGWGEFLVNKIDDNNSRLIVRTHYKFSHNIIGKLGWLIFDMPHYIMEKRMMLGIKDSAESNGENYNNTSDLIWFLLIFISGLAGLLMIFISKGFYRFILPTIFYSVWQFIVLLIDPKPFYGIVLVLLAGIIIFLNNLYLKNKK
jgi:hypothetical protein